MARKKFRPSKLLAFVCLLLIAEGIWTDDWRPAVAGSGGLCLMFCGWMAFRMTVTCDVKNTSKRGYCARQVRGLLFGCGTHHWAKLLAWLRYLGFGYLAKALRLRDFPVLRFQDRNPRQAPVGVAATVRDSRAAELQEATDKAPRGDRRQVLLFYFTAVACVATVVGTVAGVIELVITASR
jgi:hypothetical protein